MVRTLLLAVSILLIFAGIGRAQTDADGKKPADPREELRYDGKPFAYWESFGRNELKAERRVEAIRALAAFGSRGYAKEATAAIVELLKDYDNDESAFAFEPSKPELFTPDQRVIKESLWALAKIGPDASPIVIEHLDRTAARLAAQELYSSHKAFAISEPAVPILVRFIASKMDASRTSATHILANAIGDESSGKKGRPLQTAFLASLEKGRNEKEVVDVLIRQLGDTHTRLAATCLLGSLGARAKPAVPALVRYHVGSEVSEVVQVSIR